MAFLVSLTDANAGWGTLSYGSYTFPGLRDFTLTATPIYDESGRAVIYTRYSLRVHWFHVDASSSNHTSAMNSMRAQLCEPGRELVLSSLGCGDFNINGSGGQADAEWGPKPQPLEIIPIGGITSECTWQIDFAVKDCPSAGGTSLAAYCYSIDVDHDDAGITTRTVTGYVQIAITRAAGGKAQGSIAGTADTYWTQVQNAIPVPNRMRRVNRKKTTSKDRARMDFTFVDRQLDAEPPPPGALTAEVDYDIESIPPGFQAFHATLAGSIEVPVGTPPVQAAQAFVSILVNKQAKLTKMVGQKGFVLPVRVRFGHAQTTRRSTFAFMWRVQSCLDDLLKNGGIWEPLPTNYAAWAQSMQFAWSGNNLVYSASDDAIIDLCGSSVIPALSSQNLDETSPGSASYVFKAPNISPSASWMLYENKLRVVSLQNSTMHRPAQSYHPTTLTQQNTADDVGVSMAQQPSPGEFRDVTQYQGPPKQLIVMTGKAIRIQHQPSIPRLVSVGGRAVQEVEVRTEGPTAMACFFGTTVYSARWRITYRPTDGYLSSIPKQPNPALCCELTGASK